MHEQLSRRWFILRATNRFDGYQPLEGLNITMKFIPSRPVNDIEIQFIQQFGFAIMF